EGEDPGHVLMFMPGVFEILKATERAKIAIARTGIDCEVLPLHGSLTPDAQDRAVSAADPERTRRVIIATNVAETSLTIPGVRTVIDTGLARIHRYDALRGLDTLRVEPISRASAEQRAGRAGRTAPGRAIRLWSSSEHARREMHTPPEVARIDLCATMLETMSLGVRDPLHFPWLDAPDMARFEEARRTLVALGALDAQGGLTRIGTSMASVPTHPRLARALVEAQRLGCTTRVARIAACISDRDPADGVSAQALQSLLDASDLMSDAIAREKLIELFDKRGAPPAADALACREASLVASQLERAMARMPRGGNDSSTDAVSQALLAGFLDRIAFKHERERLHCAMQTRRKVELAKTSIVRAQGFLLALEIRESGPEHDRLVSIPIAHPVPRELVEAALPEHFTTRIATQWNSELRAVECAEEELFAGISISRKGRPATPSPEVEAELVARIRSGEIKFEDWETHSEPWIARVRCVAEWFPERALLTYSDDDLAVLHAELVTGCVRAREVEARSSLDVIRSALSWEDQQYIEKTAPTALTLPSGRKMKLEYTVGESPRGRSKIQDFYGLDETPKIAGGRQSITLEILGPNLRPLQVTQDLGNFWRVLYPEMRNALRRRYPRHEWR
ncbi:MAG: ATP-dependent RNA helicase, partial [Phycisphaerales bacterium]|nr:ATP-dependent RNA helicase [Phycisphaerales bacterium]